MQAILEMRKARRQKLVDGWYAKPSWLHPDDVAWYADYAIYDAAWNLRHADDEDSELIKEILDALHTAARPQESRDTPIDPW